MNFAIPTARQPMRLLLFMSFIVAMAGAFVALVYAPESASATAGIQQFEMTQTSTQAGGHPNISMYVKYENHENAPKLECECDDPKTTTFHFPPGFIGDPHSQELCSLAEFSVTNCPIASQIGKVSAVFNGIPIVVPLYNLATRPDQAGQLGWTYPIFVAPNLIDLSSRTESDYGLDSASFPTPRPIAFNAVGVEIWGVPALPENDFYRFKTPLEGFGLCEFLVPCGPNGNASGFPSPAPPRPYIEAPTTCGVPLTGSVELKYYTGQVVREDAPWPATTGCSLLTFNPSSSVTPTTTQADSASGVDVDLKAPQTPSAFQPSPSEIKVSRTVMPPGFTFNSSAADGKVACLAGETGIGTRGPAHCPEAAKIGTLSLDIAALPGPIPGSLYLGEPLPGEKYRVILTADGFATHVKLPGTVATDPATGQVSMEFRDLPQSPMQRFNIHIFGSERGLLATPTKCGSYTVHSEFVPWDNVLPNQESDSEFTIDSGPGGAPCPGAVRPMEPSFEAGSANPTAGAFSPFSMRIQRPDGDQNLADFTVETPPGLLASLKGIPYCPQAAIDKASAASRSGFAELSSPSCPAASRVGTVVTGVGAGTHPLYTDGNIYLAGPYKGAPLSLMVVVPATAGPYDLGDVAVRVALQVDPSTAAITAIGDPVPQILEGIPLRTRSLQLSLDKAGFTVNPTNCDAGAVSGALTGDEGTSVTISDHFQVANCAELGFKPKLALKLKGHMKRTGDPALTAEVTARSGDANISSTIVSLPPNELIDNAHLGTPCTPSQFSAGACPKGSVIGNAEATTPLLDKPLKGKVYLRTNPDHSLPDVVADLRGQIDIELVGRVDSGKGGGLRTSFDSVPDAPVSKFVLRLAGGKKGLLKNEESLCKGPIGPATVKMEGQNGSVVNRKLQLLTSCGREQEHRSKYTRQTAPTGQGGSR